MDAPRNAKKRKFTDKNLPNVVLHSPDFPDSKLYQDLLNMERKLDWTMMRKKMEIQDLFGKTPSTTRTLRIFLSHTVSDQLWQREGNPSAEPNFESGSGIPSWSFKIEGRLLEVPSRSKDKAPPKKFSTMIKSMVVDLERDPNLYTDGNVVEWHRPQQTPNAQPYALDGFNVRRTGDSQVKIRVIIHLDQYPEQFKVDPELSSIIEVKSDSRPGVIAALWNYVKVHNLQDKTDRKLIRLDARLRKLAGGMESIHFQHIPELVHRYLKVPDPVILHYTIRPNEPPPTQPQAWDVEVLMEDTNFKGRLNSVLMSLGSDSAREITNLDEESLVLAQQIHNSALKRDFLNTFASDPANFIQTWLASQSRDLESVLGSGPSEGRTVREEELKRSEFFTLPWVEEAIAVQEGMRLASRGML